MENISESAAPSPAHVRNWTIASVLEWVLARRLRRQSRLSLSCQERHLACQERREWSHMRHPAPNIETENYECRSPMSITPLW